MARLIICAPDGKRGILEITKPIITIGRGVVNDLVLNHDSVSRFHAVVKQQDSGSIVVADRGSTNGVVVNGEAIAAETPLRTGDQVRIGSYELTLESVEDAKLLIQPANIPASLHEVMQGNSAPLTAEFATPTGTVSELVEHAKKLEHENHLLHVLYDAGKALQTKHSAGDIAEEVMAFVFRIEGVERGFIMFFDDHGQMLRQTEVRYRRPPTGAQPQIIFSRSVLERVRRERQPILIMNAADDERFAASESMRMSGLRSAMVAPLASGTRLFAILYVDNLKKPAAFTDDELNVFALVAAQAGAAMDNTRAHSQLAEHAVQRAALERFLSPEVVEMVAANPNNVRLGGVNQKVSAMFADIRGFTSLAEKMPPERVVEILNEYFTRITDVIFGNGGTLDKYLGDGVMAVFGAPISKGNDARNAVRCAMEIQRLVVELNRDAPTRGWPELKVGIGINTGLVTAGNIGSPRRLDYTVVGDAVNVAARLMNHAAAGQVLISDKTAREIGKEFQLRPLDSILVKGKTQPIPVYSVSWQKTRTAEAE